MKDYTYLIQNFFTHKDFLVPASQMPGTLFTPLHFAFSTFVMLTVIGMTLFVSKRRHLVKRVFAGLWALLVVWEFVIVGWETVTSSSGQFDLQTNLSLYPCSLFLYTMPFAIWGSGIWKKMACGYVCTLGLLGALVNFLYPATRLTSYSCISFPGFHTFFFHGSMLFTCLTMLKSGYCSFRVTSRRELFYPCIPTLLLSIPANLVNYSPIDADYMFFRGKLNVVAAALPGVPDIGVTVILYALYILVPALFYLPSYVALRRRSEDGFHLLRPVRF